MTNPRLSNYSRPPRRFGHASSTAGSRSIDYTQIIISITVICASFYGGAISGKHAMTLQDCAENPMMSTLDKFNELENVDNDIDLINRLVQEKIDVALEEDKKKKKNEKITHIDKKKKNDKRFTGGVETFMAGVVKTRKDELMTTFDFGVPKDYSDIGQQDALIFYNTPDSLPKDQEIKRKATYTTGPIPSINIHDAIENCDIMNVVYTNANRHKNQCLVIFDNYESNLVQKWLRYDKSNGGVDLKNPLIPVPRAKDALSGVEGFTPPHERLIMKHFQTMKEYLDSRVDLLKRLRPIAEKIARKNTIIVMVVNKGQSDLLMNFACSSKAKDFDLSNVLVFATDEDTYKIVAGLGLAVFYDSKIFKDIPSKEARNYADASFASMMYAKVVSVQLINYLGFDVLFQDVDMIWFKNPLELFHDETSPMMKFDILFQDDGVRSLRYAPYSANSGFYYVRFNKKTRYLLISLLYQGDLITSTGSHQQVLAALLVEHSSTYGLRVKVLDGNITPGGYHYHNRRDFMRNIIAEKEDPYLFHMSWTQNKDNKLLFMKQMGWWYVSDSRIQSMMKEDDYLNARSCCIPIPQITCSYSDKPSAIPCKESPQIDKTGRPFW